MQILLNNCGRRFNHDWIFRHCSYTFLQGETYAVLGPNGSGKSTFLSLLMGALSPSEGTIAYKAGKDIQQADIYRHISLAAPYLELIEEFTLREIIHFHFKFKHYLPGMDYKSLVALLGLANAEDKQLKYFSSGMKQRCKLALAFCSDTPVLLLDEPTANLDTQGIEWYLNLVQQFSKNRLFVIASNQEHEYAFCHNFINILTHKSV